ncbi:tRNA (adenosine(37)-N6)-dimethylallyltransferase MiaA [Geobacillus stearothermophilus]|uniref:tRNA (adenosine(37)-N6)-dimethylallyltransferase MiaA n=1 Tax=Geobacillus stearothermophilus TaxID=1422 RepID=UPI0005003C2B|nr:tRNA (adenosine(37)-N6)-dimethylallyltransferase MiaA [Geobacillus stearothermophilus]MED0653591.1 tRNA (adenosine(37)-N6)-dimethylallyltransferase MiaA [Anoxybacillus geothermalis]ATA59633.1 tRNA dimethylallyltransferase [Geobacillus stearothermophilus]KFL14459.1 tRNA delta(2)-isopentenylpyrophosphate transferase [Geobacillus stearothermophilus]KFX32807.1 tRNA delta(2)-isopentenylpyrophosphate transferase [Geobacillus stearothermophilus]KZM55665.1 tRNA (adenosine(37)-N6)-dimethylallyltrans
MAEKVVVIVGPTAVGKTRLGIALAKKLGGEIISGDSMQIYKGMDIGTAKVKPDEMDGIPHHLLDIKEPCEPFSVVEFQRLCRALIADISARGRLPIIVGGTGLYIQAAIYDYQFSDAPSDEAYRRALRQLAAEQGVEALHRQLEAVDPESAARIHPRNVRRVIRALEVYHSTGKPFSEWQRGQQKQLLYEAAIIGLTAERSVLYRRINERVDQMIAEGLVDEARALYDRGFRDCQAVQAIGYKELYDYFDGRVSLEEAIEQLKQNSRRYAKRQLTWFRNQMPVEWFDMTDAKMFAARVEEIFRYIAGKLRLEANI